MGRNSVPKIGEWRDGELHKIVRGDQLISYEVTRADGTTETLACAFNDSIDEVLISFWMSGHVRGKRAGRNQKTREIKKLLEEEPE